MIETEETTATIEGLTPNTEYEFMVKGLMKGEEPADTEIHSFRTLEANPVPFDIAVETKSTSAHLSWTGYGDQ